MAVRTPVAVKVAAINEHVLCRLCGGYIIEATVVVECLHSFCRSCIVKYVKKSDKKHRCPICHVLIREAQPLAGLRYDRTLQDLLDKLLPQVREDDKKKEELFNTTRNIENTSSPSSTKSSSSRNSPERSLPPVEEEKVSFLIKPTYSLKKDDSGTNRSYFTKYLRCSVRMTVSHIKRFLVEKSGWCHTHTNQVEILCRGNVLRDELTLEFVWRIRWGDLGSLLVLEYTRREKQHPSIVGEVGVDKKKRRKRRRSVTTKDAMGQSGQRSGQRLDQSDSSNAEDQPKKTVEFLENAENVRFSAGRSSADEKME